MLYSRQSLGQMVSENKSLATRYDVLETTVEIHCS